MSPSLQIVTRRNDLLPRVATLFGQDWEHVPDVSRRLADPAGNPAATLVYDLRDSDPATSAAELQRLHEQSPGTRLIVATEGGLTLEEAEAVVRHADDEWDLGGPPPDAADWRSPRQPADSPATGTTESTSKSYLEALELARRVASQSVPVVLSGETGAGKTTLARFLHDWSDRQTHPFTVLACGAVPRDLLEADLFGNVRGAFTSANETRIGRLEAAGRGSLLLDEVDLLGLEQQAKLLRVVESGAYEPVGSTETKYARCRLIFATNINLENLVAKQQFRSDLFFRINVVDIRLPPLRERLHDIPLLAVHCLQEAARGNSQHRVRVNLSFLRKLCHYDWPGNIRELKNRLLRAHTLATNGRLNIDDLGLLPELLSLPRREFASPNSGLGRAIANTTTKVLEQTLLEHNNNRAAAARALGISRSTLYRKLERLNLNVPCRDLNIRKPA